MEKVFSVKKKFDKKKAVYVALAGVVFMLFVYILNPSLTGFAVSNADLVKIPNSDSCAKDGKITLQFIYADDCDFCKNEKPIIAALEQKYAETLHVERIDYRDARNAWVIKEYDIVGLPTMIFNCEYAVRGYKSFEQLENLISILQK